MAVLGIFGGTFNPIHHGHLALAQAVQAALGLHRIQFVPSASPPHKSPPSVTPAQRAAMVSLAIADYAEFELNEIELQRNGPSYTVDTLQALRKDYPQHALCLIMGLDSYQQLPSWHDWQQLLILAHVAVVDRASCQQTFVPHPLHANALQPPDSAKWAMTQQSAGILTYVGYTPPDISSSQCRLELAHHEADASKIPLKVLNYIRIHQLYAT